MKYTVITKVYVASHFFFQVEDLNGTIVMKDNFCSIMESVP